MAAFGVEIGENPFDACETVGDISGLLASLADELNIPFYSYLMLRNRKDRFAVSQDLLLTNYDQAWCDRYMRKLYMHYDPVAVVARKSRLPFFWNDNAFLRPFRKNQKKVFHEARSFDICTGYSVPISGPNGDIGVFSVVAAQESHVVEAVRGTGSKILMSALQAHDKAALLNSLSSDEIDVPALPARELECLKWTAEGKTSDEIGEIISVSPATVVYHLNKSVRRLDASNRHHAAVKAIRLGLI